FVYANVNGCSAETSFEVRVFDVLVDSLPDVSICDSYTLPALVNGSYFTGPNGTGLQLAAGEAVTATQTLYIYNTSGGGLCSDQTSFNVEILSCSIPKGISPNGDGLNDSLDLSNFDVKRLSIFNRYGRKV
ncbi:gliding motility-associated C-terminal domain-containing protein, partial [Arthrospira platensis SPKY2]